MIVVQHQYALLQRGQPREVGQRQVLASATDEMRLAVHALLRASAVLAVALPTIGGVMLSTMGVKGHHQKVLKKAPLPLDEMSHVLLTNLFSGFWT